MPAGSHIGQLSTSFMSDELPIQFLMHYDYDFLYQMKCTLLQLRRKAKLGIPMVAHSVMEELIIYLCNEEAEALIEVGAAAETVFVEYKHRGYIYGYDWLETVEAQERVQLIQEDPIQFLYFTKPTSYCWNVN